MDRRDRQRVYEAMLKDYKAELKRIRTIKDHVLRKEFRTGFCRYIDSHSRNSALLKRPLSMTLPELYQATIAIQAERDVLFTTDSGYWLPIGRTNLYLRVKILVEAVKLAKA